MSSSEPQVAHAPAVLQNFNTVATDLGLLVTPPSLAGESLGSYLMRLAAGNYLAPEELSRHYAETRASIVSQLIADISALDGRSLATTKSVANSTSSARKSWPPPTDQCLSSNRVCPRCLRGDPIPYLRCQWNASFAWTCSDHDVMLLAKCPACRRAVVQPRTRLHRCDCGFSYADAQLRPVPGWLRTLMSQYGSALRSEPLHGPDDSPSRAAAASLAALRDASRKMDLGIPPHSSVAAGDDFFSIDLVLLERWFSEWPYGARRSMVQFKALDADGARLLKTNVQMDIFPGLQAAFDEEHYDDFEPIGAAPFRVIPGCEHLMTRSELVARCGVPFSDLKYLARERDTPRQLFYDGDEMKTAYYRDWGMDVVRQIRATDTVEQAIHMTGFTSLAIHVLSSAGIVRTLSMGRGSGRYRVSGPKLCILLEGVGRVAKRTLARPTNDVWLSNAVALCSIYHCVRRLMKALESGALSAHLAPSQSALASHLWIDATDLEGFLKACIASDHMPEQAELSSHVAAEVGLRSHAACARFIPGAQWLEDVNV